MAIIRDRGAAFLIIARLFSSFSVDKKAVAALIMNDLEIPQSLKAS
ncbi:MAG TPA: hypothetical protein PLV25_06715 [Opitutales bacterium]|nr:hypothetical protein [Opitutales bacterium]